MNKRSFHKPVLVGLLCCICFSARAEQKTWNLVDGTSFEAELVAVYPKEAAFKNAKGRILKVPLERFAEQSRIAIELENPPSLSIDILKKHNSMVFPSGINSSTQRPPEIRCHYGVRIKQTGPGNYNHELEVEFFIIGRERLGDKFILLDRQKASFSMTRENRKEFEFRSSREVVLQDFVVSRSPRGEAYYGYVVLVRDVHGETIAVESSHDWLLKNLENLSDRYARNYMDDTCTRVFPTRPPIYTGG